MLRVGDGVICTLSNVKDLGQKPHTSITSAVELPLELGLS